MGHQASHTDKKRRKFSYTARFPTWSYCRAVVGKRDHGKLVSQGIPNLAERKEPRPAVFCCHVPERVVN